MYFYDIITEILRVLIMFYQFFMYKLCLRQVDAVTYTAINVSWNPSSVPQLESYCLKYTPAYSTTFDYELMLPSNVVSYSLT